MFDVHSVVSATLKAAMCVQDQDPGKESCVNKVTHQQNAQSLLSQFGSKSYAFIIMWNQSHWASTPTFDDIILSKPRGVEFVV